MRPLHSETYGGDHEPDCAGSDSRAGRAAAAEHDSSELERLCASPSFALMEDMLSGVQTLLWVKDRNLHFVSCNEAVLDVCGALSRAEVRGRSAAHFFSRPSAAREELFDRQVLNTREPLRNSLQLVTRRRGGPLWILSARSPLLHASGEALGVVTVARIMDNTVRRRHERLSVAAAFIRENFRSALDLETLASHTCVSPSQLERDFGAALGVSPRRYLMKARLEAATALLVEGHAIADVAHACGYSDQSAFSRQFKAVVGMPPSEYRRMLMRQVR